jgi:hypothetical protein
MKSFARSPGGTPTWCPMAKWMMSSEWQSHVGRWLLPSCARACVNGSRSGTVAAPNTGVGVARAEWRGGWLAAGAAQGNRYAGRSEIWNRDGGACARRSLRLGLGLLG